MGVRVGGNVNGANRTVMPVEGGCTQHAAGLTLRIGDTVRVWLPNRPAPPLLDHATVTRFTPRWVVPLPGEEIQGSFRSRSRRNHANRVHHCGRRRVRRTGPRGGAVAISRSEAVRRAGRVHARSVWQPVQAGEARSTAFSSSSRCCHAVRSSARRARGMRDDARARRSAARREDPAQAACRQPGVHRAQHRAAHVPALDSTGRSAPPTDALRSWGIGAVPIE